MELNPIATEFVPVFPIESTRNLWKESKQFEENMIKLNEYITNYIDNIVDDKEWNKKNYKIDN
jgi:hypothetical protein